MESRTGRTIRWVAGLAALLLAAALGFTLSQFAGEVESGRADATGVHGPGAQIKVIGSPGMEETIAAKNAVAENTPAGRLVLAARGGDATRVRELLAEGIPPDAEESMHGHRALHQAAKSGQVEVVEMLLAAGAEPNGLDGSGMSPLMRASYAAVLPVGERLLAAGADVNARSDPHGETALGQLVAGSFVRWFQGEGSGAASNHRGAELEFARMLFNRGADPNLHPNGQRMSSPLKLLAATQNAELLALFVERGARAADDVEFALLGSRMPGPIAETLRKALSAYRGALVPTEREFPMGYPIAADAGRMTFVYPDPGFATDRPLR